MSASMQRTNIDVAGAPAAGSPPPPAQRRRHWALGWLAVIVIAGIVSVVLRLFVVQTFFVPSISMYPTLQMGDRILVQKIDYSLQRGAIIVFQHPKLDTSPPLNEDLVKRIIGLPGETISSRGNTVYIDGKPLAEPWLPKGTQLGGQIVDVPGCATNATRGCVIPKGEYFMMGDNRSDSDDSRTWGPIPSSTFIGRVFLVVWRHGHPTFDVP
jgi:signal peptidase I